MKILRSATLNEVAKEAGIAPEAGKTEIRFFAHITGGKIKESPKWGQLIILKGKFAFLASNGEKILTSQLLCTDLSDLWDGKDEVQFNGVFKAEEHAKYKYVWKLYADEMEDDPVFNLLESKAAKALPAPKPAQEPVTKQPPAPAKK